MSRANKDEIIAAYDEALNQLNRLQNEFCSSISRARGELFKARKEAIKKAEVGPSGT